MSANAGVVVLLQFWVTARIKTRPPMLVLAVGSLFYLVGFVMYGFVGLYGLFLAAMMFITVGEMLVLPVAQALAAQFAPPEMRGRYMAFFGISWVVPTVIGRPSLASSWMALLRSCCGMCAGSAALWQLAAFCTCTPAPGRSSSRWRLWGREKPQLLVLLIARHRSQIVFRVRPASPLHQIGDERGFEWKLKKELSFFAPPR